MGPSDAARLYAAVLFEDPHLCKKGLGILHHAGRSPGSQDSQHNKSPVAAKQIQTVGLGSRVSKSPILPPLIHTPPPIRTT